MQKIPFERWEYQTINELFGFRRLYDESMPVLDEWLAAVHTPTSAISEMIEELRAELLVRADAWNEDELKMLFIAPLLAFALGRSKHYKIFTQRPLSIQFPDLNIEASGRVELILARGEQHPRQPFFFFHEYKQERKRDNDPLGQILIAMIAAREENQEKFPLFGCFVTGRLWYFVILDDNKYNVSMAYDSTQKDDILKIFSALKEVKKIIETKYPVLSR